MRRESWGSHRGLAGSIGAAVAVLVILVIGAAVYFTTRPATSSSSASLSIPLGTFSSSISSIISRASSGASRALSSVSSAVANKTAVAVTIPLGSGTNQTSTGYSPASMTVVIGVNNTVTWTNNDIAAHTVTDKGGTFDSGSIAPGKSYTYTFSTPGTYSYYCKYHSWMAGTIVVKAS